VGWLGEALKIQATAPPEKGETNEAVIALVAERLESSTDDIQLANGRSSAAKVLTIAGMDGEAIKKAIH